MSGFSSSTRGNIILTGLTRVYFGSTPALIGATQGGFTFAPNPSFFTPEIDGVTTEVEGLPTIEAYEPTITLTAIEVTTARLSQLMRNIAFTGSAPATLTPKPTLEAMTLSTPDNYLRSVEVQSQQGAALFFSVQLPVCRAEAEITGQARDTWKLNLTLTGVAPVASPRDAGFRLLTRTAWLV